MCVCSIDFHCLLISKSARMRWLKQAPLKTLSTKDQHVHHSRSCPCLQELHLLQSLPSPELLEAPHDKHARKKHAFQQPFPHFNSTKLLLPALRTAPFRSAVATSDKKS